jgi:uncharacterized membrane protein YphA (DoxX/SURF4 family)
MPTTLERISHAAVLDPAPVATPARPSTPTATAEQPHATRSLPAHPRTASPTTPRRHVVALAGLQLLLGYQLFLSGADKLLYATFPATLGRLLTGTLAGATIPAPFAAFLRAVVLPHSVLFGYLVEWGETLAGLGLLSGALVALAAPALQRRARPALTPWLALLTSIIARLAVAAAAGAALMGLTFYLLDGAPSQWLTPSVAFGGALDAGMVLLLGSLALLADAAREWLRHRLHERLPLGQASVPFVSHLRKSA